jgi:hypothetical protein
MLQINPYFSIFDFPELMQQKVTQFMEIERNADLEALKKATGEAVCACG